MKSSPCTSQTNKLRLGLYRCPNCNVKVEIFSDENSVQCYNCDEKIYREKVSPCIDWCVSAHDCVEKNKNHKKEMQTC